MNCVKSRDEKPDSKWTLALDQVLHSGVRQPIGGLSQTVYRYSNLLDLVLGRARDSHILRHHTLAGIFEVFVLCGRARGQNTLLNTAH